MLLIELAPQVGPGRLYGWKHPPTGGVGQPYRLCVASTGGLEYAPEG